MPITNAPQTMEAWRGAAREDVVRCLYKLVFQLLLLLETNNKMVVAVYHAALDNRVRSPARRHCSGP